jgi:ribosomal protein S18 acetylase RimI-like enzyme
MRNGDLDGAAPASDGLIIRPFTEADLPRIHTLVAEMQDFERGIDPRLLPGDAMAVAYTRALRRRCADEMGEIFVAAWDGDVIGFVAVSARVVGQELDEPPGSYALVTDLSVTASHRGRGTGRALLRAAEEYAGTRGAREIRIVALAENPTASGLYRSVGFRPYLEVLRKDLSPLSS